MCKEQKNIRLVGFIKGEKTCTIIYIRTDICITFHA